LKVGNRQAFRSIPLPRQLEGIGAHAISNVLDFSKKKKMSGKARQA
jgi:hypothetical protein